jgi:magnesium chelatase family protein
VDIVDLESATGGESSAAVRARVERTRAVQAERRRSGEVSGTTNAQLAPKDVSRVCAPDVTGRSILAQAVERRGLSARAYGRVLRVARTIADMEGSVPVLARHVAEAIASRILTGSPMGAHAIHAA